MCLSKQDKPVYCLDVKDPNNQATMNYIKSGEEMSYNERYLTKKEILGIN